jgi:hypothetical protein
MDGDPPVTRINCALFNYKEGGRRHDGSYDFRLLQHAFAQIEEVPSLVLFCEAKNYRDHAGEAKYAAAEALSDELGVPIVAELGSMARAPMPPAIFYDPTKLVLRRWWQQDDPGAYDDQRNVATFAVREDRREIAESRREFRAVVHHFEPLSGEARLEAARRLGRYGDKEPLPVIGGGDLNATASGPHLPQRVWPEAAFSACSHKGIQQSDGSWQPDTRALDHLIGAWEEGTQQRRGGCGFRAVAEMAWQADPTRPILPTVNDGVDKGGGLLIDWLLANDVMAPHVDVDSYTVHVPERGYPYPSDHRLVTVAFDI